MPASADLTFGWDVGGAHLKAARIDADGGVVGVWQEICPLWRGLAHLHAALDRILARNFPENAMPGAATARHAVTMTGEMTDLFADRADGVQALAALMAGRLGADVRFYAGAAGWTDAGGARHQAAHIASANWHASAQLVARHLGDALLVDIGSTTTDIIPLRHGALATTSVSDADRLAAGELVYTGIARTPLMALCREAPLAGRWLPLMAEHFATSADVWRVLDCLPEGADLHDSADGGAKTPAASRARLARMVGVDAAEQPEAAWRELAAWLADAQLERIGRGIRQVLSRALPDPRAPLVMAGAGAFLGPRLAARIDRPVLNFSQLPAVSDARQQPPRALPATPPDRIDWCAPAVAVGLLLAGDPHVAD